MMWRAKAASSLTMQVERRVVCRAMCSRASSETLCECYNGFSCDGLYMRMYTDSREGRAWSRA
jgi:hypothetical protein